MSAGRGGRRGQGLVAAPALDGRGNARCLEGLETCRGRERARLNPNTAAADRCGFARLDETGGSHWGASAKDAGGGDREAEKKPRIE